MSIANILCPNQLSLYCSEFNGVLGSLTSYTGLISEIGQDITISTTTVPLQSLQTEPGHSYDIEFLICGICIAGTHSTPTPLGLNQFSRYRIKNIGGTVFNGNPISAVPPYTYEGTINADSPLTTTPAQVCSISGTICNFSISVDTGSTWRWQYYIKILSN